MRLAPIALFLIVACVAAGCATEETRAQKPTYTEHRGVHSGMRERVDFYFSVLPTCEISGYPEVRVLRAPRSGNLSVEKGEDHPTFPKENVRWDCNRKLIGSTRVFYQSNPGFHGNDSFYIEIRWPDATIRAVTVHVEVL